MDTTQAKSAKSAIQLSGSQILTSESFPVALSRSFDDRYEREFMFPLEGEQFFRNRTQKFDTETINTRSSPTGMVPQNRDSDDMAYIQLGDGFSQTHNVYTFRLAAAYEQRLKEVDDIGAISGLQKKLIKDFKYTLEKMFADVLNRSIYIDGSSRTSVLADDGCFIIDEGRNNPIAGAGTWSNKQAASAITETSLFTASLAADQMVGEDGILFPREIKKMVIGPAQKQNMWTLLETDRKLNSSNWNRNWANGAFDMNSVIVYRWLTSSYILYMLADPKSDDNELYFSQSVKPGVKTWVGSDNPDVTHQRIRAVMGVNCGTTRKMWMGGVVS